MEVNYNVWGAPETWVDGTTAQQKAGIKYAAESIDTYREQYLLGNIPLNSIDISAAFWGIGANSVWCKQQYLSPYQFDGETRVAIDPILNDNVTLPLILMSEAGSSNQYMRYSNRYLPTLTDAPPSQVPYATKIMLDLHYTDIMLVPWVQCKRSGWSTSTSSYSLYDYLTNARYNIAPEIISIGFQAYAGDGTESRSSFSLGFCSPVDYKPYDLYYGSVYFWTQQGCSQLLPTSEMGTSGRCVIGNTFTTTYTSINSLIGDATTALAYKYSVSATTSVKPYYFDPDNDIWSINKTSERSGVTVWNEYPYIAVNSDNIDDVKNYILSQIAFLGFAFVYNPDDVSRGQIGDIGVYLPKFDNKGVTTGEYEEGTAALALPNSQWTNGRESGYDPNAQDDDGDTGELNNFPTYQNRYANANAVYALDESNFIKFVNDVNILYTTDTDDTRMKLDFKGSNPNDYIIGVYGIPFLCNYVVPSGGDTSINLGPVTLPNAQGKKVDTTTSLMRDCGTVIIPAKGNFLDYEPYTQIELYIPMCGTIQLDCAQVVGHTLHVIVHYDITTMACVGCVYRDTFDGEMLIHTINGTIGASLPLTSARMGDYQNSVQTTKNALKQNEMRTALGVGSAVIGIAGAALAPETGGLSLALAGAAIGGIATAAGGAMNEKQLQYDLTHKQPALSQCSAADGMTAQLVSDLRPWVFIKRAKKLTSYDEETYGKTVGFACCINSTVGAFSGFTVYSNADLSGIPATKTEIDMIRAKLNSGIYI